MFAKVPHFYVKFDEKYAKEVAKIVYGQPYLRKGQVLGKNGTRAFEKSSNLITYSDEFDNGNLQNLPSRHFIQIE